MDDLQLIEKIKKGDTESFSELVLRYEQRLVAYAYRMLKNQNDAEDAAQEAFLRVYRKLDTFAGDSSFTTWIFTVLNNICLDMLRKQKRSGEQTRVSIHQSNSEEEDYELAIPDTAPGPYEAMQQKSAMEALETAIAELSDEHRAVFLMRDVEGLEYEEIARITNTTLGTVKSRISRARLALRKILENNRELFL